MTAISGRAQAWADNLCGEGVETHESGVMARCGIGGLGWRAARRVCGAHEVRPKVEPRKYLVCICAERAAGLPLDSHCRRSSFIARGLSRDTAALTGFDRRLRHRLGCW